MPIDLSPRVRYADYQLKAPFSTSALWKHKCFYENDLQLKMPPGPAKDATNLQRVRRQIRGPAASILERGVAFNHHRSHPAGGGDGRGGPGGELFYRKQIYEVR